MDIQTQDGIILRGIPDGTPEAVIRERLAKIRAEGGQKQFSASAEAQQAQTTVGGVASEVGKGALRGPSDVAMTMGRAGASMLLGPFAGQLASQSMERLAAPSRKAVEATPATPTERFAGTLAEIGAGGAVGGGLRNILNIAMTTLSAVGGATGEQIGGQTGKVVGSVAPIALWPATALAGAVGRTGRNIIDPWLPGGTTRAAVRTAAQAAGPDRDAIAAAIRSPQELVPGSAPTAGEAAAPIGRAEFSALQELVKGRNPTPYENIAQAQNAARVSAVRTVGHDKPALEAAIGARTSDARVNYEQAGKELIAADDVLNTLMQRPSMDKVLSRAKDLAKEQSKAFKFGVDAPEQVVSGRIVGESGQPLTQQVIPATNSRFPVDSLHYMKMAMDDLIKNPERFGIGASEARAISETQKQFVAWLGKKSEAYDVARSTFAAQSRPINQMEVGQYLEGKLSPALSDLGASGSQRSQVYAQALRDAPGTMKRATGQPRYEELSEVLNPQQMRAVTGVGEDLARASTHERLARAGMEKARDLVGQIAPKVPAAGMFNPHYSVLRAISNRVAGKIEGKSLDELSRLMQSGNVKELGEALAKLPLRQREAFVNAIHQAIYSSKMSSVRGAAVTMQEQP